MRLIAKLDIVAVQDTKTNTGLFTPDQTKNGNYAIVLNMLEITSVILDAKQELTRNNLETTLAHELGHFVAQVFQDPTHDDKIITEGYKEHNPKLLVPAEMKAWNIAEVIKPDLNKTLRDFATNTYRHGGHENG